MRLISSRLIFVCSLLLLLSVIAAGQTPSQAEASRLFPKNVGAFRSQGVSLQPALSEDLSREDFGIQGAAEGTYLSPKGKRLNVLVLKTQTQAGAYALLTDAAAHLRRVAPDELTKQGNIGTSAVANSNQVVFYRGTAFVGVSAVPGDISSDSLIAFAQGYAQTLEEGENVIPVLVKHLPEWETAQDRAVYAVSLHALQKAVDNEPVLDAINFAEGTEAITANYDTSRLVIVEYTTPQIAESNDARITERIKQLRESGQPAPSAYRRVGNYSVLVFGAPDEVAASQLIDGVKYEQRIQWLGQDPFAFEGAAQQHTQKAVSLILGIAKTIGFFLALCLGAGGVVGGIFFLHRRAQQRTAAETYSDAGGMLRLNLDEMTPQTDPTRLLKSGE